MDIAQAIKMANSILDEERALPTVEYTDPIADYIEVLKRTGEQAAVVSVEAARALKGREQFGNTLHLNLYSERGERPRPVHESPHDHVFRSVNFTLLLTLYNQLQDPERHEFISALLARIPSATASARQKSPHFPCYYHQMSELPLVAEFCVRIGHANELFAAINGVNRPTVGLVLLLLQLEETIALNFNLLSDQQLAAIPAGLKTVYDMCEKTMTASRIMRVNNPASHSQARQEDDGQANEMMESIKGIDEECRKARYFYLKHSLLQQLPNLEIESDKTKVVGFLDSLGFDPLLTASLAKAEDLYRSSSDAFDLKSCLGHIRSFYEHLNIDAGQAIAKVSGATVVDEWDPTLTFLRNKSFLSAQQDKFARGLYTLLSDEGVHSLIAEREFARLLRNVVIEYGLMFLTMFQKKGIKIRP